jgi:hypothetical protein
MNKNPALTDEAREQLIATYGRLMQEAMQNAKGQYRVVWLGEAHRARHRMQALIARRTAQPHNEVA